MSSLQKSLTIPIHDNNKLDREIMKNEVEEFSGTNIII